MKNHIDDLVELLSQTEGIAGDDEAEQILANLRYHWDHADIAFHAAFYHLKKIGPDGDRIMPAVDELREAFGKLESCSREWKEYMESLLP